MFVLVAGTIAVGKTAFAAELSQRLQIRHISVRAALLEVLGTASMTRAELQSQGADLDRRTAGRWLLNYVSEQSEDTPGIVIDSIRTRRQAQPLLNTLPNSVLVYLDAHPSTRRERYAAAAPTDPLKAAVPFDEAMSHPTEHEVVNLMPLAHLTIETDDLTVAEVVREAIDSLHLVKDR